MLKNIKDLSGLIKIDNQFGNVVSGVLKIIKNESGLMLQEKDIYINKNILKIKLSSNIRFVILLHLKNINKNIKDSNLGFILEV